MMHSSRTSLFIPALIIAVGTGWLLNTLDVIPRVNWIWTLGLAIVGIGVFAVDGFNKMSIVIGPFFIAASILSVMRQTGRLAPNVEVPCLVIIFGALLLIARLLKVPPPRWLSD